MGPDLSERKENSIRREVGTKHSYGSRSTDACGRPHARVRRVRCSSLITYQFPMANDADYRPRAVVIHPAEKKKNKPLAADLPACSPSRAPPARPMLANPERAQASRCPEPIVPVPGLGASWWRWPLASDPWRASSLVCSPADD